MDGWKEIVGPTEARKIEDELYEFVSMSGNAKELAGYLRALNSHSLGWSLGWVHGAMDAHTRSAALVRSSWWDGLTGRRKGVDDV